MPSRAGESDIALSRVATEDIDKAWRDVEPLLRMGCEQVPGFHTPDNLLTRLLEDRCTLWTIKTIDGDILASAVSSALGNVAIIEVLGGKHMEVWKTVALERFEEMARANGMNEIEIEGRVGWKNVLPGYAPVRLVLRKKL